MKQEFYNKLAEILSKKDILTDEPMKAHTTFRVGGAADYFVTPKTKEALVNVISLCQECEMPFYIMGNGSNLLVSDQGFRGVIIQIFKEMNHIIIEDTAVEAEAGALLSAIAAKAYEAGLTGFEFAAGIPGTLGGACVMNAGAYGGEMKDILKSVVVLDKSGNIRNLNCDELELGYRTSIIAKDNMTVLSARLELKNGEKEVIRGTMDELKDKRITKQPLEYASAGSTFKRPEGYFAGKLIQDAGLRGFKIGDAQVSEKHSGFIINCGNASAADVMNLISHVTETVEQQFGIRLETEVKRLGEF